MIRRIFSAAVLLCVLWNSPVHAQSVDRSSSLKAVLVEYLYQYGKELFYRGIDPQEASFVFQRALTLDCAHQGAQAFLNKLHKKYPQVSIRIWGCADAPQEAASLPDQVSDKTEERKETPSVRAGFQEIEEDRVVDVTDSDGESTDILRRDFESAEDEMKVLEDELKEKDALIVRYKTQLSAQRSAGEDNSGDLAYSKIASDQKDLIRIQQNNIDYLKSELNEAKKQAGGTASENAYTKTQIELADSSLEAQEHKMTADTKDAEARGLRERLNDLQEQLALVQKIVDEKNRTIESLQKELKSSGPTTEK